MLQRVVDYYKRYKRPILVVGGISSFVYVTSHYAKSKFLQFQERTAKDRASKENLRRRYDQNQIDAMYTILALVQVLNDQISKEYKLEELVARISNLKSKGNSPPLVQESLGSDAKIQSMTKLQLWEELKILTFTRTLGAIYLVELLGLFGYIQMNLLGRLIYIESVSGPQSEVELNEKNSFFFPRGRFIKSIGNLS